MLVAHKEINPEVGRCARLVTWMARHSNGSVSLAHAVNERVESHFPCMRNEDGRLTDKLRIAIKHLDVRAAALARQVRLCELIDVFCRLVCSHGPG